MGMLGSKSGKTRKRREYKQEQSMEHGKVDYCFSMRNQKLEATSKKSVSNQRKKRSERMEGRQEGKGSK